MAAPSIITSSNSGVLVALNFYDKLLLERLLPNLVHAQFGQKRPLPAGNGKSVYFTRYESLSAATTPLSEGVAPSEVSFTNTQISATIAQYGSVMSVSDLVDLTAFSNVTAEAVKLIGENAGNSIDQVVRDIIVAGTTIQYAAGRASRVTVASTDKFNVAELLKAVRTLESANAKKFDNQHYVAIVHPRTVYDLRADTAAGSWLDTHKYSQPDQLFTGEIGQLYGVRFVMTSNAKVFTGAGSGGIDVYATMIFGPQFYGTTELDGGVKMFIEGPGGIVDPLHQRKTLGWKANLTAKILNDNGAVRVEHAVS